MSDVLIYAGVATAILFGAYHLHRLLSAWRTLILARARRHITARGDGHQDFDRSKALAWMAAVDQHIRESRAKARARRKHGD